MCLHLKISIYLSFVIQCHCVCTAIVYLMIMKIISPTYSLCCWRVNTDKIKFPRDKLCIFHSSDLRYNHIKEVPSNAFSGLTQAHSIFLNENQITEIHPQAFNNLPSLRYLYLNQNHVRNIAANAFVNLVQLERL